MKTLYTIICLLFISVQASAHGEAVPVEQATSSDAAATPGQFQVDLTIPVFSPDFSQVPIAVVNGDTIKMNELTAALAGSHEKRTDTSKRTGRIEYIKILDRLINARLISQEAATIGLDELPEYKAQVDMFTSEGLVESLRREVTKDVKASPEAVEKLYKSMVIEWKIKSVLFEKAEDALQMAASIKAGQDFDQLAAKAVAENVAKGGEPGEFVKPKALLPAVFEEVSRMQIGAVSPAIEVPHEKNKAYTILRLEDKRYPDNEATRMQAEQAVLSDTKAIAFERYRKTLRKKHAVIQEDLLKGLDYDSATTSPQVEKLLKDKRALAVIKGEKPITVADLTQALRKKHFHGLEQAAKKKKINADKRDVLHTLLDKRVIIKEALVRGLDKDEEYLSQLQEFKDSKLFDVFLEKVVFTNFEVKESELQAYYEAHKSEYVYPEMVKLTGIAFNTQRNAEAGLKKLEKGADINWVRSNADGVVAEGEKDKLSLDGRVLSSRMLPQPIKDAIAGAKSGDYRLYANENGFFYVLWIEDITPAQQQPYQEVREAVSKKVLPEKFGIVLEDWFKKLRENSEITVYLTNNREANAPDTITRR